MQDIKYTIQQNALNHKCKHKNIQQIKESADMKNTNTKIFAQNGSKGLDIYLIYNGEEYYLVTRRYNHRIYMRLQNGITLDELKSFKPKRNKAEQKEYKSINHMIKVTNDFIKYELVA